LIEVVSGERLEALYVLALMTGLSLAVRHLQQHKKRQDAERQVLGEAWREHGLVFASSIGTPVEPRNVNLRWDELWRRAGLDWVRLHDVQHGCARLLLAKGVPDRVITEVPGRPTPWMSCSERDVSDFGNSKATS
jgi:hypothetical protein